MYHFIVNPNSRSGAGMKIWIQLESVLKREHISFRAYFTRGAGHAAQLARMVTESPSSRSRCIVVAIGGDGTVNEVINGLCLEHSPIFGYIPTGSGNDFAKGLCLPSDPHEALHNILRPSHIESVNVGCMYSEGQERRFIGSSGMGFDASICLEALRSPIKRFLNTFRLGKLTYVLIALKQLAAFRPVPLSLHLDGRERLFFSKAYFFCVMNLPYEGGGFRFAPDAKKADGLLDICVLHDVSKPKILFLLPLALFGLHTRFQGVTVRRCSSLQATASRPLAVHADGESFGHKRTVSFTCLHTSLSVITLPR